VSGAEAMSRYESIPEETSSTSNMVIVNRPKLGKAAEKRWRVRLAADHGGRFGIGAATAKAMAKQGAEVAVLDRDGDAAEAIAKQIGGAAFALACRRDGRDQVAPRLRRDRGTIRRRGHRGLQSPAPAWQGRIGEVDDTVASPILRAQFFATRGGATPRCAS